MSFDAPPPPPPPSPFEGQPSSNDFTMAALAHGLGVLFGFLPALIIMLTAGKQSSYVRQNAVEALNFQILVIIASVVSGLLTVVLIGLLLLPVVIIAAIVFPIIGAVKSSSGESYRYPLSLRLVK